jgi:hypothetical protein
MTYSGLDNILDFIKINKTFSDYNHVHNLLQNLNFTNLKINNDFKLKKKQVGGNPSFSHLPNQSFHQMVGNIEHGVPAHHNGVSFNHHSQIFKDELVNKLKKTGNQFNPELSHLLDAGVHASSQLIGNTAASLGSELVAKAANNLPELINSQIVPIINSTIQPQQSQPQELQSQELQSQELQLQQPQLQQPQLQQPQLQQPQLYQQSQEHLLQQQFPQQFPQQQFLEQQFLEQQFPQIQQLLPDSTGEQSNTYNAPTMINTQSQLNLISSDARNNQSVPASNQMNQRDVASDYYLQNPGYTSDFVNTYTIPEGTILYHATTNKKGFNTYELDLGQNKELLFFTPNFRLASDKIQGCSIDKQNGYIHVFKVKRDIPNIYIKNPYDINDDINSNFLREFYCEDGKYFGIGFFYPINNIQMFSNAERFDETSQLDFKKHYSEYAICNPKSFLEYLYTQRCESLRKISTPYRFDRILR